MADEAKEKHEHAVQMTKACKKAVEVAQPTTLEGVRRVVCQCEQQNVKEASLIAAAAWKLADEAALRRVAGDAHVGEAGHAVAVGAGLSDPAASRSRCR